ncbi:hypothetical protein [Paenibacillus vini]|uniref:DUF3553 domain-containing protein n=1 Tax=Paenibacillus vini TaxID=1476024 RepID=A0ABQ4MGT8_9BACL|nr:hypothetical protein [Paenibacillus vini]GIP55202.1 hypothetical protein J42TS3_42370 [Paenibacillus vini]
MCHIDGEWCFYCEMYLPLVAENELLKVTLKNAGIDDPTSEKLKDGDSVLHKENKHWGTGVVRRLHPNGLTATVDFKEGINKYHLLVDLEKHKKL